MKERNVLIDFIKGISILLMVMAHSCPPQLLKNIVYLFHIGLFIMHLVGCLMRIILIHHYHL